MSRRHYIITFVGLVVAGLAVFHEVGAASGETCDGFNGVIPDPPNDATCTLTAQAADPETDRVYYWFRWGDGTTTYVPNRDGTMPSGAGCDAWVDGENTVPSDTKCWADHTYASVPVPPATSFSAFVSAYDEANHESVYSRSVLVFITSQILSASLNGAPATSGWFNSVQFAYNTSCSARAGFTLQYCRTQFRYATLLGSPYTWSSWANDTPEGNPNTSGQSIYAYSGVYDFPASNDISPPPPYDGGSYQFRATAADTSGSPAIISTPVPSSGQIRIDRTAPLVIASSPAQYNSPGYFVVSATMADYPIADPVNGIGNSGISSWDLQYKVKIGNGTWSAWTDCRAGVNALPPTTQAISFGESCVPVVSMQANSRFCFRARGRDSTSPTQNERAYTTNVDGDSCTDYRMSNSPIAPHDPTPDVDELIPATGTNFSWYGGDPDYENISYSVYISQPNATVNVATPPCSAGVGDCDGIILTTIPCVPAQPTDCFVNYGAPNRVLQPGASYQWRVQSYDGYNIVDSTPLPWRFRINRKPVVNSVVITPAVVNQTATVTWQVTDQDVVVPPQQLTSNIYYGSSPGATTNLIVSGIEVNSTNCTGGPNGSGWNCTYTWEAACAEQILSPGQYITIIANDGIENSLPASSASTFTINHTETRYFPASSYDTNVPNDGTRSFDIEAGSILTNSSFVRFRGACNTTDEPTVDANAEGNVAVCTGCSLATGNTSAAIPLNDLIPGQTNTLNFSVQGCGFTDYRITYNHVTACDKPYLGVEQGSIYSQGNIRAQYSPPEGKYNATYLILGGGTTGQPKQIENFISGPAKYGPSPVDPSFGTLVFPGITSSGSTRVSSFDYYSLTNTLSGSEVPNGGTNLYGHTVQVYEGSQVLSDVVSGTEPLQNKIYWVKGDVTVNQDITFVNATGASSGAGLIIVEGDLNVNSNMTYAEAIGITARNLASVGWLVRGNVLVNGGIREMVGAYYVEGGLGLGEFRTGSGTQQLTVYGAVIAKQLLLQRTASTNDEPSERVVADGRILLNTPPGFVDIMSTLPTWQFRTPAP